ncbi:MAG: hypothetical protein JSR55_05370 [Proteobacteria bacterium]|nr:hypothetical protein [Pseudomonadota bacterium]
MHVHLPKPLHGWREFAGEVGIIVVGVLIALAAEQLVDAWQWREKTGHAEDAMRIELADDDGPQAYARELIGACLDKEITRIRDGADTAPPDQLRKWTAAYAPPFRTWDSEAWKIVVASDIGSHMGAERLIAWSAPYRFLPQLTEEDQREARLVITLRADLPPSGNPSPSDLKALRLDAAQLRLTNRRFINTSQLMLARMNVLNAQVPETIQRRLTGEARAMYGDCVAIPDLKAKPGAGLLSANLRSPSVQ